MTDTHDTNLPEKQVELEEEKKTVEVSETATAETPAEEQAMESTVETAPAQKLTKEEVIARLKEIAGDVESVTKAEIDGLKQTFYKLHNAEQEAARKKFAEAGGAPEDYVPTPDPLEEEMKNAMSVIKNKRNELAAEVEKQKEMNLQVKLSIIEELKDLLESPEDANKNYTEFKRLQQQWNEVKLVPQASVNELWKNYQLYVEKFYDLLKLNNEFREYDFKKNLEIKTHLCEAAEKLAEETDVVSAFHQLQKLHQEFRETGPVAKELREEIWARFKAASTAVNRRHQQHFDALKEAEQQNLDQKTVICEIIEGIDYNELTNFAAWDAKTQEIIALQNKWKTIGYAPQKMNVKIFERFRAACDAFFNKKAEFFKTVKENMNENLEKKRALCEKAEALKDSTDWKATADTLVKLQKEWKTIGPVAKRRHLETLHHGLRLLLRTEEPGRRLTTFGRAGQPGEETCHHRPAGSYRRRNRSRHGHRTGAHTDEGMERRRLRALQGQGQGVQTIPLSSFKNTISNIQEGSPQALYREREKLMRAYDNMKSELQTYENNLGFLNAASKKGNSLLTELNRKVEKLKADIDLVKEKIKVIDESIQKEG